MSLKLLGINQTQTERWTKLKGGNPFQKKTFVHLYFIKRMELVQ